MTTGHAPLTKDHPQPQHLHGRGGKPARLPARFIDGPLDACTGQFDATELVAQIDCAGGAYRLYPDTSVYRWTPHPGGAHTNV